MGGSESTGPGAATARRMRLVTRCENGSCGDRTAPAEAAVPLIGRTLAPETVAEMALAAMRENRLYVITHDEGLEPLRRRFQRMEQAILERKP